VYAAEKITAAVDVEGFFAAATNFCTFCQRHVSSVELPASNRMLNNSGEANTLLGGG